MPKHEGRLTRALADAHPLALTLYGAFASFGVYFCMFAFRKPFTVAQYEGKTFLDAFLDSPIQLKSALVTSQIIGYALAKWVGVKFCSEATRGARARMLTLLILMAEFMLLLFAWLPPDWKVVAMFLNGLPLGMVWGLVVLYLEGRRTSEALLAGLSCSYILASGVTKDIGRDLMAGRDWLTIFSINLPDALSFGARGPLNVNLPNPFALSGAGDSGVSEFWMPFCTGLLFLPPFLVAVWLLDQMPEPSKEDQLARVRREPMDRPRRRAFVRRFLPGVVMLLVAYFFVTAYRDFRDIFGAEIFSALGEERPGTFSRSESWVTLGVLSALAALVFIRDNRWGLVGAFLIMTSGAALLGVGTLLFDAGRVSGATWMILTGLGVYLAYVPYGSVLFDRLIASTGVVGTAVFAIYLADFVGYVGTIGVMQYKDLSYAKISHLDFFRGFSYFLSILATVTLAVSCIYFVWGHRSGRHAGRIGANRDVPASTEPTAQDLADVQQSLTKPSAEKDDSSNETRDPGI